MGNLQKLFRKKNKLIIGLMSGTSADGIDAVLLRVQGSGAGTKFQQMAFTSVPYPKGLRLHLLENSRPDTARLDDIARLNFLLGEYFAETARRVARRGGKKLSAIDLIGSHGQTIGHYPERRRMFGKQITSTMQIAEPSVIAKRTGVVTVGDFRVADVAVGGSGAPLVPYVDYILFRTRTKNRALLNLGGIANITVLKADCGLKDVIAFDTGPGNMIIDALMQGFYKKPYDNGGRIARTGVLVPQVLGWLMRHPYLRERPPKSTGREVFGGSLVDQLLRKTRGFRKQDVVATAAAFTALSVYEGYIRFVRRRVKLDELFVSGGGAHNAVIMEYLRRLFHGVKVMAVEEAGISSDAKEAICFALLANEAIAGNPANVMGATGARRSTVLGTICMP